MTESRHPLLVVIGGFLGAGKTTIIQHTTNRLRTAGHRVGIITNDQSSGLVDTEVAQVAGDVVIEITDGCFCCQFDVLEKTLSEVILDEPPDIILAEAVGSCTDLAATVLQPLRQISTVTVDLGPLTVVADGRRLHDFICPGKTDQIPPAIAYLYERQLAEADVILLNKVDLLSPAEQSMIHAHVNKTYPGVTVAPVSAINGDGFDPWLERLVRTESAGERVLDLDYDRYAEAERSLGWVNLIGNVEIPVALAGAEWMDSLLRDVARCARRAATEIAHVKAWLGTSSGSARGHIVGTEEEGNIIVTGTPSGKGHVIINARAPASPETLLAWVQQAILQASEDFGARFTPSQAAAFKPGRPIPIHRLLPASK